MKICLQIVATLLLLSGPVLEAQSQMFSCGQARGDYAGDLDQEVVRVIPTPSNPGTASLIYVSKTVDGSVGYFLTAAHVVKGAEKLSLRVCDDDGTDPTPSIYEVEAIKIEEQSDLAILRAQLDSAYAAQVQPISISARRPGVFMSVAGISLGYPAQTVGPPDVSQQAWKSLSSENYGLVGTGDNSLAMGGQSGSPILWKDQNRWQLFGIITDSFAGAELTVEEVEEISKMTGYSAVTLTKSGWQGLPVDPSAPVERYSFIDMEECLSRVELLVNDRKPALVRDVDQACFTGQQPAITANRVLDWLSTATDPEVLRIFYEDGDIRDALRDALRERFSDTSPLATRYKMFVREHLSNPKRSRVRDLDTLRSRANEAEVRLIAHKATKDELRQQLTGTLNELRTQASNLQLLTKQELKFVSETFLYTESWTRAVENHDNPWVFISLACAVTSDPTNKNAWSRASQYMAEQGNLAEAGLAAWLAAAFAVPRHSEFSATHAKRCSYYSNSDPRLRCPTELDDAEQIARKLAHWFALSHDAEFDVLTYVYEPLANHSTCNELIESMEIRPRAPVTAASQPIHASPHLGKQNLTCSY